MRPEYAIPLLALTALLGTPLLASTAELPPPEEMWKMLQRQQQEIDALKQQLAEKAKAPAAPPAQPAQDAQSGEEKKDGLHWSNRITLGGVVDVRANAGKNFANVKSDDITIDTVKLSIDAKVADMVSARAVLLHEEANNSMAASHTVDIDEATITLGDTEKYPVYLTAGRKAVPFGNFSTKLINDPLTLRLGETKESILQLGFQASGFYGSLYSFNGDSIKAEHTSGMDQFGGNLGFANKFKDWSVDAGVSYINSIEDAEELTAVIPAANMAALRQHIPGLGVHGVVGFSGFTLIGEYIGAMERFTQTELPWNGVGAKPRAWGVEGDYEFDLMGKNTTVALAWQGSGESLALGFPESRLKAGVAVGIFDRTTVAFEFMSDKDYASQDVAAAPGTYRTAKTGTLKLGVEF